MFGKFIGCDFLKLEVHRKQDRLFHLEDFLFGKLFPTNFVINGVHLQRINFFIFCGSKHWSNAHDVQIWNLQLFIWFHEKCVHELDAFEERFLTHFIGRQHLYHPINHFSTQVCCYGVLLEEVDGPGTFMGEMLKNIIWVLFSDGIGVGVFHLLLPVLGFRSLGMLCCFFRLKVIAEIAFFAQFGKRFVEVVGFKVGTIILFVIFGENISSVVFGEGELIPEVKHNFIV